MATQITTTVEAYLESLSEDRREAIEKLRATINQNLPKGFKETISYGMIGWVVPHETYPSGYHCDPKLPLPFLSIASQKNFIAFYHMGMYMNTDVLKWFEAEYPNHSKTKLDMGKSCVRFKKPDQIPFELIGTLMTKMTVQNFIDIYEKNK